MCFIYTVPRLRFERGRVTEPEWPSRAPTGLNFSELTRDRISGASFGGLNVRANGQVQQTELVVL